MTSPADSGGRAAMPVRVIEDAGTLKAMADQTRLAILQALSKSPDLPVMSVKELAAELGEPQTKLYRHIRQLEAAGLIRVAATRIVSGIVEQRYQAAQLSMQFGPNIVRDHPAEAGSALGVVLDAFRDGLSEAFLRELSRDDQESPVRPTVFTQNLKVSPAVAEEVRRRVVEVRDWLLELEEEPEGLSVNVLLGYYTALDQPGQAETPATET